MTLTKEATNKKAQIAAPKPTNAQKQYTSPREIPETLIERARDKAWSLYLYYRLFRLAGDEYLPILDQLVIEIQALQDEVTDLERSQAEAAEVPRNPEVEDDATAHMGRV